MKGNIAVISSTIGAAKGALIKQLCSRNAAYGVARTITTRAPRPDETDGRYEFVSCDQFCELIKHDALLEWTEVRGILYGTTKADVRRLEAAGKTVILLDLDPDSTFKPKQAYPNAIGVFLCPASEEAQRHRLQSRNIESREIERLVEEAARYRKDAERCGFYVVNDDAVEEVEAIIEAYLNKAIS